MSASRQLSAATGVAAVIGHPVAHSLSPALHNAAFEAIGLDWVFVAFAVPPGHGEAAVRSVGPLGLRGMSVTMPHKDAAAAAVDRLSPVAEALGAVNCVVNTGDEIVGENTDGIGFVDALRIEHQVDPSGLRCVVVGAGGAARSVIRALAEVGAAEIAVLNRSVGPAERAAALAGARGRVGTTDDIGSADLVVNATPIGMLDRSPNDPATPIDPSTLSSGQVVADLIVHPQRTELLHLAEARGATVVPGLGMLVHQAAHAFTLWTGEPAPLDAMWKAVRNA